MPVAYEDGPCEEGESSRKAGTPGRLVLCFDGTGDDYQGTSGDTNIVKMYKMMERADPNQWHYYQPGIGTYSSDAENCNPGPWGRAKRWFSQTMDQGFGSSFDRHVIAGYKFLMRYYDDGDQIYVFGFSRGAFTARFLARMIAKIGILSKGNEEMISFAYTAYQKFEVGFPYGDQEARNAWYADQDAWFTEFQQTFCRQKTQVYFLGLFDTVRSVGTFDNPFASPTTIPPMKPYAVHVRHAVSLDERRCKFKPSLMLSDNYCTDESKVDGINQTLKEVWFSGNHGDVGGGWDADDDPKNPMAVSLSSFPLQWMIDELEGVNKADEARGKKGLAFNTRKDDFLASMQPGGPESGRHKALTSMAHDTMSFGKDGGGFFMALMWNIMDYLPLGYRHLDTSDPNGPKWVTSHVPNCGRPRPAATEPEACVTHESVEQRKKAKALQNEERNGSKQKLIGTGRAV